ncbi:prolyl oligopeptidase family serine peptidase [Shewanella benthica]|uniref:prolyl oligopeptidase family serine peptidase n=1 Tax=Shewanella benthica TaxID=43661 RepID=UPI00187AD647|nr:prolyl oligopeptidase family serine peptidase [Shewanella benthica]MBE7216072.1 prolyl oligopeptidase family serine peptidase [Shewanella benthica]MCL1063765.1 prolyl oligopeptidase family serine peptidase [Shewanella benthica]
MRIAFTLSLLILACFCEAAPIPGTELFRAPAMSQVTFSPDARFISALMVEGDERRLSLIGLDKKIYSDILAFSPSERLIEYIWIDSQTIFVEYTVKGQTRKALLIMSEKDGKPHSRFVLLPENGDIVDTLPNDPQHILYAKNKYDHKPSYRLYKMTLDQLINWEFKQSNLVEKKLKNVAIFTYDASSNSLFALTVDIDNGTAKVRYRPLNKRRWKLLIELNDSDTSLTVIGFIDNEKLAVLSNQNTDKVALYEFDIKTQKIGKVLYEHPKYDLIGAELSDDGDAIKLVRYVENGHSRSHFFDIALSKKEVLLSSAFKGNKAITTVYSSDERHSIVFSFAANDPGAYYLYDKTSNGAELLTELYPELLNFNLRDTEVLKIKGASGVEVEAYLTQPSSEASNGVLLVMPHGGPIGVRDFNYFDGEVQYFVSRGFTVLRVNFRGSEGYGKQFLNSGKGEFGKAIEQDITSVVNMVKKLHKFTKTCAIGTSYGGYSSLMLAIKHPTDYHCAIGRYGIYDLPLLFNGNNLKVLEQYRKSVTEVVGEFSESLTDYSPVYLAQVLQAPVLLIAGRADRIADFEHSKRMEYVLNKLGKQVETLYYKNTGHGQESWYWQRHEVAYTADYLRRTLGLADYHQMKGVDEELTQKLAADIALLADGYKFDNKVENDSVLAIKLYRKAAVMGEGRSAYNLAKQLIDDGKKLMAESEAYVGATAGLSSDTEKGMNLSSQSRDEGKELIQEGVSWADKSSLLGFSSAGYWLGLEYESGVIVEKSWQKSLNYFTAAADAGHDAKSLVRMGRVHCLAPAPLKDVKRCSELLMLTELEPELKKNNEVTDESRKTLRWALADIYAKGEFSQQELTLLQGIVKTEYKASPVKIELDDVEFGEIEYNFRRGNYNVTDDADAFTGMSGLDLGATFEVKFECEDENVALIGRWLKQGSDGELDVLASVFIWGDHQMEGWNVRYTVDSTADFDSKLILEIRDLNNTVLATRAVELH